MCGGAFKPSRYLQPATDENGRYYLTPLSVSNDALAPCFDSDTRFYSCPVALAAAPEARKAYGWYHRVEKRLVGFIADKPAAIVDLAVDAVEKAYAAKQRYDLDKRDNG